MYVWGLSYWTPGDALVNKGLLVTIGFFLTWFSGQFTARGAINSLSYSV
jgi:hypothetical protein